MLRTTDTELTEEQVRAWALAVGASGGMAIVSDDLTLLDDAAADLLVEVLGIGRRVDAAAVAGDGPRCEDLMTEPMPRRLRADGVHLEGEPERGFARVVSG